jgi:integrase
VSQPKKITHSRGVSYEITYRVNGRMVRSRFTTKQAALDAAARARSQVLDGTHIAPAEGRTTVATYTARWLQTLQVRPQTLYNYEIYLRCHVLPTLGQRPLSSLRRSDIQTLIGQLSRKGLAPRTVDSIYKIVAMVMRSAVYDRLIPVSPCYKIKVPAAQEKALAALNPEQVRALLAACRPRDRALIALAVGTGMRQGEALGVRLPHLNLLKRELAIEEQCLTPARGRPYITSELKTRASRGRVPLPQFAVEALARHLEVETLGADGALFVSPLGNLWRRGSFNESVWKPALLRAGLDSGYGFHALRHTYASGLISQGLHPRVIQARLGHASISETMDTYGHLFPDADEETAQALDRLFGGAAGS